MKITFNEVQGHFTDAKLSAKHKLKLSDARLGKLCYIVKEGEGGSISKLTDLYTYGEMVAFLTGLRKSKKAL